MQGSISPRELLGTVNFNAVERAPEYPPRWEDSQPFTGQDTLNKITSKYERNLNKFKR